jgi:hypothetical protein
VVKPKQGATMRAMVFLLTATILCLVGHSNGGQDGPKDAKEARKVEVAAVSMKVVPKVDVTLSVNSIGQFLNSQGGLIKAEALRDIYRDYAGQKTLKIAVLFENEKKTTLSVLGETVDRVAESAKQFPNVVIYLRLHSISTKDAKKS